MRYQEILEACWKGYRQAGMKKKGDRMVPNCVPVSEQEMEEDLKKWFREKWVRFGPDGRIRGACARGSESEGKPKCLPQSKAHALGKKGRASAAAKKRREDPNPERRGPAKNVATKVLSGKKKTVNEFDASGYNRYSIYIDDYDLKETFADLDDAIEAIEQYKRDDPKSQFMDYNVRDLNGEIVWRNDAWQDIPKPGKIQFLPPKTEANDNQVGTLGPRQQIKELTQADVTAPVRQTSTPPRRAYSIVLDGRPGKPGGRKFDAVSAWNALAMVFPQDYPGEAAQQKVAEVAKKGSAVVKTGITSEDIAQTYVSKLSRFVPAEHWRIIGGRLDEAETKTYYRVIYNGRPIDMLFSTLQQAQMVAKRLEQEHGGQARIDHTVDVPKEMKEASVAKKPQPYNDPKWIDKLTPAERSKLAGPNYKKINKEKQKEKVDEKQDACYRKVKSRYKVWPSAYASGALVQCRKKGAANWGNKKK